MNDEYLATDRFLRLWQVAQMISLSKTKIYEMQANGAFPKSFRIAGSAVGWSEADIRSWMNAVVREAKTAQER